MNNGTTQTTPRTETAALRLEAELEKRVKNAGLAVAQSHPKYLTATLYVTINGEKITAHMLVPIDGVHRYNGDYFDYMALRLVEKIGIALFLISPP